MGIIIAIVSVAIHRNNFKSNEKISEVINKSQVDLNNNVSETEKSNKEQIKEEVSDTSKGDDNGNDDNKEIDIINTVKEKYTFIDELSILKDVKGFGNYGKCIFDSYWRYGELKDCCINLEIDLDGDDNDEVLEIEREGTEVDYSLFKQYNQTLYINSVPIEIPEGFTEVWLVDLNVNDSYIEVVTYSPGPSDDPNYTVIRYNNNNYEEVNLDGYFLMDGEGRFFADTLLAYAIAPGIIGKYYEINDNGIKLIKCDTNKFKLSNITFEVDWAYFLEDKQQTHSFYTVLHESFRDDEKGSRFEGVEDIEKGKKFQILEVICIDYRGELLYVKMEDGRIGWLFWGYLAG